MSMAPGPSIEPHLSLANAFSRQDNDNAPSCAHIDGQPPRYTEHDGHYHPVLPRTPTNGILKDSRRDYYGPNSAPTEKPKARSPKYRVSFIFDSPESIGTPATGCLNFPRSVTPLKRGLQIPSKRSTITSGFKLPSLLQAQGVSQWKWKSFTKELGGHAELSGRQLVNFAGMSVGYGLLWNFVAPIGGFIPGAIMTRNLGKKIELENFETAQTTGALDTFTKRWNETYFEPLGLQVTIATPGHGSMDGMDVASTKLFKFQQKAGIATSRAGAASGIGGPKEARYQILEGHQRVKAAHRARIIFVPVDRPAPENNGPQESGQIDIREYFDGGGGDGNPESNAGSSPPDPGFIPAGRLAAATTTTLQPIQR